MKVKWWWGKACCIIQDEDRRQLSNNANYQEGYDYFLHQTKGATTGGDVLTRWSHQTACQPHYLKIWTEINT